MNVGIKQKRGIDLLNICCDRFEDQEEYFVVYISCCLKRTFSLVGTKEKGNVSRVYCTKLV